MHISVISVGKLKEIYLKQGIAEFEKRLKPYCQLQLIEVKAEPDPESHRIELINQVKEKEGERILQHVQAGQYVIALDVKGVHWSSEQFAAEVERLGIDGRSHIVFIIGGSNGLAEWVLNRADVKLSFSKMTFPHQMMKLILLEQIYRAFRMMRGAPYHK